MFSGSIVALVTPFTLNNQIDFTLLTQLIEWHITAGTHGIVLAGTTGESATLSDDEKIALAKAAVNIAQGRIEILIGNGSNNTAQSIALTQRLNKTGIDGYLTVTPYYNKPTDEGLIAHFSAIAAVTKLPIILYNVPSRTLCDLSNDVVLQLAKLNNIVGIKDATADLSRVTQLRTHCKADFVLLSGDDASALDYYLAGGNGVISVTANIAPKQIATIQTLLTAGKVAQAKLLDQRMAKVHHILFIESNPIAVKWALYWLNKLTNANLRLPLLSLSNSAQTILVQTLKDSGIKPCPQEN